MKCTRSRYAPSTLHDPNAPACRRMPRARAHLRCLAGANNALGRLRGIVDDWQVCFIPAIS
eukprot:30241-Rhodomonas_salina.2